ncbi:ABC transporter substrate-binding protein [Clostridium sp.]|jgi:iron complex transport system substrate-binding protein|uniref:ABC transporter substrate-binding protein n=1 Tax=Clostridium sp. TaxID=1506 RepID=UPI00259019D4|nr:ABC transporter substrate-binding protein [Clostridium sp.]MDF2504287.1 putative transporter [Clostridium sp.]
MSTKKRTQLSIIVVLIIVIFGVGYFLHSTFNKTNTNVAQQTSQSKNSTREITDMDGNKVTIPAKVERVGTSWPGFCNVIFTVGGGNKLSSAPQQLKKYPWAVKLFPNIKNIDYPFAGKTNIEELIKSKPDVVFLRKGDEIQKIKESNIPVVMIDYKNNNIEDVINAVVLTGKVLGDNEYKKALAYKTYFNKNIKNISSVTSKLQEKDKSKTIYLSVSGQASVWGKNTPQDEAIRIAGGINVAANDIDGYKEVSIEQILKWNPDVIVIEGNSKENKMMNDSSWQQLKAVKDNKVFISPNGVFAWARLGSESSLQLPWLAKTLYPEEFKNIDISKETKYFYNEFFNYKLTDDELSKILNAQNPS